MPISEEEVRDNIAAMTDKVLGGVVLPRVKNRGCESFVVRMGTRLFAVSVEQLEHLTIPTTTVENVSGS